MSQTVKRYPAGEFLVFLIKDKGALRSCQQKIWASEPNATFWPKTDMAPALADTRQRSNICCILNPRRVRSSSSVAA